MKWKKKIEEAIEKLRSSASDSPAAGLRNQRGECDYTTRHLSQGGPGLWSSSTSMSTAPHKQQPTPQHIEQRVPTATTGGPGWIQALLLLVALNVFGLLTRTASGTGLIAAVLVANTMTCWALLRARDRMGHAAAQKPAAECPIDSHSASSAQLALHGKGVGRNAAEVCTEADGGSFYVRTGPNYSKLGLKAPSEPSLYELCSVDIFRSDGCQTGLAPLLPLPRGRRIPHRTDGVGAAAAHAACSRAPSGAHGAASAPLDVPQQLVIAMIVPLEGPSVFSSPSENAPTLSAVFCFRLTEASRAAAASCGSPALRLLARYFREGTTEESVKKRFKVIGQARNYDDLNLPRWMKRFNAKPVIINKSGVLRTGVLGGATFMEMDILVREWSIFSRQGLHSLMHRYKDIDAQVGFVLQATRSS